MRPQTVMDNTNSDNHKNTTTNDNYNTDTTDEMHRNLLDRSLLRRPYAEQIHFLLTHIIPAAVIGWQEARDKYGVDDVTAFDLCATLAIGCVELRTFLLTGIDITFCSCFARDMPGVPYADRALWEIVHLSGFDSIPHAHLLPFSQEQMRLAVADQISSDMAGAGIVEPLTADLLDRQIAAQEQQTRQLVQSGDMNSFCMASAVDRAISLIRLRLAGMDGVAVHVNKSNLPAFLADVPRNYPQASVIAITEDALDGNVDSKISSVSGDWLKA